MFEQDAHDLSHHLVKLLNALLSKRGATPVEGEKALRELVKDWRETADILSSPSAQNSLMRCAPSVGTTR